MSVTLTILVATCNSSWITVTCCVVVTEDWAWDVEQDVAVEASVVVEGVEALVEVTHVVIVTENEAVALMVKLPVEFPVTVNLAEVPGVSAVNSFVSYDHATPESELDQLSEHPEPQLLDPLPKVMERTMVNWSPEYRLSSGLALVYVMLVLTQFP